MHELPTGTVTFLFTDVEGSTRLLHELGDEYADVLAEHRRVLRDAFATHGGVEVDTQGDAFFVAFEKASEALAAAADAQRALAKGPMRVRMGIHTGEPLVTDDGYVGVDVHRAARIAAVGHGSQILVSQSTRELCGAAALRDLGEHRLKDLTAPERIFQLGGGDFPPLKSLYRTNLPIVATPIVGRARELVEARELVRAQRLLTLTGPGGSGKTRLALHLASDVAEDFPDGVYWVPLQAIRDPAIVERTIAATIGAEGGLTSFIGAKRILLLLDNFEQVVDAAPAVASIVENTPHAKLLVTSREPLHVTGEHCYPVEPLERHDAETLFDVRARSVSPAFRPAPEVAQICERLDRLPLAIELAAARVALLEPAELLMRLDQRLPLLASRARDAPERQRTLRATIEWSFELLPPDEQRLFRRLAVFRGSFSLAAAEAICDADVDAIESLVLKNLLRRRWETNRLLMLDTIREYAADGLGASDEANAIRRRHAEFFLDTAHSANLNAGDLRAGGQRFDIAFEEQDNFRAALAWAIRGGEIDLALDLVTALEQFWALAPTEGVRWHERAFAQPKAEDVPIVTRAHALRSWGSSLGLAGDMAGAEKLWEQSLALFEKLEDGHGCAVILHRLAITSMLVHRDLDRARQLVDRSHDLHAQNDDWWARTWGHAQTRGTQAAIARDAGDEATGRERFAESAALAEAAGVDWWQGGVLAELAALALRENRVDDAERDARASLEIAERLRDRSGRIFGVGLFAAVHAERGHFDRAGLLWGAIEDEQAFAPNGGWSRHREECLARIRRLAGNDFEAALHAGRELELHDAVRLALGG